MLLVVAVLLLVIVVVVAAASEAAAAVALFLFISSWILIADCFYRLGKGLPSLLTLVALTP